MSLKYALNELQGFILLPEQLSFILMLEQRIVSSCYTLYKHQLLLHTQKRTSEFMFPYCKQMCPRDPITILFINVQAGERGRRGIEISQKCSDLLSVLKCLSEWCAKKNKVQSSEWQGDPITAVEHVKRHCCLWQGEGKERDQDQNSVFYSTVTFFYMFRTRVPFCSPYSQEKSC